MPSKDEWDKAQMAAAAVSLAAGVAATGMLTGAVTMAPPPEAGATEQSQPAGTNLVHPVPTNPLETGAK